MVAEHQTSNELVAIQLPKELTLYCCSGRGFEDITYKDVTIGPGERAVHLALDVEKYVTDLRRENERLRRLVMEHEGPTHEPALEQPKGYLHEINEPYRGWSQMYSASEKNPWSHWVKEHADKCEYRCTPLYARPSPPPVVGPLKLDTDRQVFFYEQDHYYLSNFSAFIVEIDGKMYPTSEHAYHCYKFPGDPLKQSAIRLASSAHEAFKMAERWRQYRMPDWDNVKADVMLRILRAKVEQHEYVRRKLLETGDRELIENSWRDDVWGWGPNRDGMNLLGNLWMLIRAELRASAPTKGDSHEA